MSLNVWRFVARCHAASFALTIAGFACLALSLLSEIPRGSRKPAHA